MLILNPRSLLLSDSLQSDYLTPVNLPLHVEDAAYFKRMINSLVEIWR